MTFEEFKSKSPINAIPLHEQVRQFYAEQARRSTPLGGASTGGCPGGLGFSANGEVSIFVQTSSGYVTYVVGGTSITLGSGDPSESLGPIDVQPSGVCIMPGGYAVQGYFVSILDPSASITNIDMSTMPSLVTFEVIASGFTSPPVFSYAPGLQVIGVQEWPFTTIDLSGLPELNSFSAQISALTSLDFSANPLVTYVYCPSSAIADVDATINSLNPANPNGTVDLTGGTSASRTSASDVNYNALVSNGWNILTN